MNFNKTILIGRLTATPELKHTQSGLAVTSFTVAVDRPYRKDKERQADFLNVVAWRKTAEFICQYFTKGSEILVEGSLQSRRYDDSEGKPRTAIEVVADNVNFGTAKKQEQQPQREYEETDYEDDDLPF